MTDTYYLTQEYIFRCIEKNKYEEFAYENEFKGNGDYLYNIWIIIGYKDNKIYFPFIGYEREKNDGKIYIYMGDEYIKKQYGDISLRYNTLEDVYKFIKTLLIEFPKDMAIPEDVIYKTGIVERNFEDLNGKKHTYETLLTINEEFTLEYFIIKINNIINIDKYIYILKELKDCFGSKLTKPLTGVALPWMNNIKLKEDYPNLKKWL